MMTFDYCFFFQGPIGMDGPKGDLVIFHNLRLVFYQLTISCLYLRPLNSVSILQHTKFLTSIHMY